MEKKVKKIKMFVIVILINGVFLLNNSLNDESFIDGFEKLVKRIKIEYMFFLSSVVVNGGKVIGVSFLKGKILELLKNKIVVEDFKVSKVFKLFFLFSYKDRFKYF